MRTPSVTKSSSTRHDGINIERPITVTVATACKVSGLGPTSVWARIGDGTLSTVQVGRRRLVLYDSLLQLLTPVSTGSTPTRPSRGRPRGTGKAVVR
jgi:hypothetical protein